MEGAGSDVGVRVGVLSGTRVMDQGREAPVWVCARIFGLPLSSWEARQTDSPGLGYADTRGWLLEHFVGCVVLSHTQGPLLLGEENGWESKLLSEKLAQ